MWYFFDSMFPVLFFLVFCIVIGTFLVTIVKGMKEWNNNNHSPRLTVEATVVARRTDVSLHSHPNAGDATGAHGFTTHTNTSYYATFQVESGDRMELQVSGSEYGMLVEGDHGRLTFQGTRYLEFDYLSASDESMEGSK